MRLIPTLLATVLTLAFPAAAYADCLTPDLDGDGHDRIECGGDDCDDDDVNRYPGNVEVCDDEGHDEDCDYSTPGQRDTDGDGYNDDACSNSDESGTVITVGDDCDDGDAGVHPNQAEVCNNVDTNCDGQIDEGLTREYWQDLDGDGFGDKTLGELCPQESLGAALRDGDCDDESASLFPGVQVCDGDAGVLICETDGTWTSDTCDSDLECRDQPNELGVCMVTSKDALKEKKDK